MKYKKLIMQKIKNQLIFIMKKEIHYFINCCLLLSIVFLSTNSYAQTQTMNALKISNSGTTSAIAPTAILDLQSTNKGFVAPRMTTAQRNAIVSPTEGLMIYNLDRLCYEFYRGALGWYNECCNAVITAQDGLHIVLGAWRNYF